MNRLVIIGNGFDMAHGLKTSYMDFINWYWERRLNAMLTEHAPISEDCLCKLEIKNTKDCASWSNFLDKGNVANIYNVKAIPAMFLMDANGKLIATGEDARGVRLSKRLAEAFQ